MIIEWMPKPRKQAPWMKTVKVGDVLQSATGTARIVRKVTRYDNGDLSTVTFAIMRKSWTNRPYTIVNYTDLNAQGYEPVGLSVPVDSTPIERELQEHIADHRLRELPAAKVIGLR